jgi:hypothetical protein
MVSSISTEVDLSAELVSGTLYLGLGYLRGHDIEANSCVDNFASMRGGRPMLLPSNVSFVGSRVSLHGSTKAFDQDLAVERFG